MMKIIPADNLACPLDGEALKCEEKRLVCNNGHSFDIARQGYVNLLPVQHKKSRSPGDSKAMVEARQRFLNSELYAPIAEKLCEIVDANLAKSAVVLDAGCGEGYYLDYLARHLKVPEQLSLIGIDIAKPAVLACTRRNRQLDWLVASNRTPPLLANSVDMIICMFAFPVYEAFKKILKPGGCLILVEAGHDHLIELRRIIYAEIKTGEQVGLQEMFDQGFALQESDTLSYLIPAMPKEQLDDLLLMTPHLFRASREGKQAVAKLQQIDLTVDVSFQRFELATTE